MKFTADFIDRVREATNIVPLISQYVQLRRSGGNFQGICPFHHEKTPSFSVSEEKQVYFCFGCKASGNVFNFVQQNQGLTFREAVEYLATRASIAIPANEGNETSGNQNRTLLKVNGLAAQFFHQELKKLPPTHEVQQYLGQRGLTAELVDTYKLGYDSSAHALTRFFEAKRVPTVAAEQVGLIKRNRDGGDGHYDLFRQRLIFPIFSPTGQCLGFGGRVMNKDQQPKYLNSPDAPVFHKGKVFYGLNHSAKFIRSADEVIVVEGYMDWLALAKVSISNVVATLGTALTADHAHLIKRYTNKVLLLFDGDEAGKSAARRSLPILLSAGLYARGLFLPDKLDPDDFLKERGEPGLRQLIQSAPDLFELVTTEQWLQAKGSPTGKIQLLDEFAPHLVKVPDLRLRRLYSENFANMIGVDIKLVEQSIARAGAHSPHAGSAIRPEASTQTSEMPQEAVLFDLTKAPRAEVELLNVILMQEVYLKEALEADILQQFSHLGCKAVFTRISEVYGQMPNKFDTLSALLANHVRPVENITRHLAEPFTQLSTDGAKKLLQDCIKRVKTNYLKSKSKELVSGLRGANSANSSEQLEQIMNIHKNRRSLNRGS